MKNWLSTRMLNVAPMWLGVPLGGLGAFFVVMKPLGFPLDWTIYAGCLILAIVAGAVTHRYYEMSVVESNRNSVTFQVGRRPHTVVDPTDPQSVRRSSSALVGRVQRRRRLGVVCPGSGDDAPSRDGGRMGPCGSACDDRGCANRVRRSPPAAQRPGPAAGGGEMSSAELETLVETETDAVVCWRFEELVRAGYDDHDAAELAHHPEVDLHRAVELVRRGCPSNTALRIIL